MSKKQTFEQWKAKVDKALVKLCGMVSDDLPDYMYYDEFEVGESPGTTARRAWRNAQDYY